MGYMQNMNFSGGYAIRLYVAISELCCEASLDAPEGITCTLLRKYMAIVFQVR